MLAEAYCAKWFHKNDIYTGKRYEINTWLFVSGVLKTFPNATFTAFYRPFIYESLSNFIFKWSEISFL